MNLTFPNNFLWGSATSSHQVEGNNINNDWWSWEQKTPKHFKSLAASRHYELFRDDFTLAKNLNHNCHRFSIEWSRIEPKEAEFNQDEIEHYRKVLASLRENNLEPIVTLHHFTNPKWFSDLGGWLMPESWDYFLRYVEKIILELGKDVKYWITINEPMVYVYQSYITGKWPPGEASLLKAFRVKKNLINAHIKAYKLIHNIYRQNNWHPPLVSIADNLRLFIPCQYNLLSWFSTFLRKRAYETIDYLAKAKSLDFIGVNYYNADFITFKFNPDFDKSKIWIALKNYPKFALSNFGFNNIFGENCETPNHHHVKERTSFGWPIYPKGLFEILVKIKKYNLPILITENGIYAKDDELRWQFIVAHLIWLKKAISSGVNVIGYIYWSLMDNFEWDSGFNPCFGLVEIDYNSFKRIPRQSAYQFAKVCNDNGLFNVTDTSTNDN